ncbi:orotate phosphoribosyltransferase-like protein [Streptomyces sp. AK010]|nr:orotate phosphoribosyltransferase-like protein [Streptomyces sp. AK010]
MTHAAGKYAGFEESRERAVALRRAGLSRRQIRDRLHVDNNDILNRLLQGEPAPD